MPGNDYYTSTLLHFDGSSGSTTITQSSSSAISFTTNGTAQLSTVQKQFGSASILFDGSSDGYITTSSGGGGLSLSSDFTIDFWMRLTSSIAVSLVEGIPFAKATLAPGFSAYASAYISSSDFAFYSASSNSAYDIANAMAWGTPTPNVWEHWAVTRASSIIRTFKNGVLSTTVTSTLTPFQASSLPVTIGALRLGSTGVQEFGMSGYIDEFRITQGLARWTANFTPPVVPYDEWEPGFDALSDDWASPLVKVAAY